ncbi:MAG: squalene synthase HpnC [Gammaproteobacteria bacterium]|jgi:hydroxysqualene synthase
MSATAVKRAYAYCVEMAKEHYENFPVASLALPRRLRRPVSAIYAFARTADDLADEGLAAPEERLAALDAMDRQLQAIERGTEPEGPLFTALADTIGRHHLPIEPFRDLLRAFRLDVTKHRYADFAELMGYCRWSANPVGRLLLHLYDAATERNIGYSDGICTALQLINFLQDLYSDYNERGRIYLPADEMERFGVGEAHLRDRVSDAAMHRLVMFQVDRATRLLRAGAPLGKALKGRAGFELRMIVLGGNTILKHLRAQRDDLFSRPRLTGAERMGLVWQALKGAW